MVDSSFLQFSKLPTELRVMIWHHALPQSKNQPGLYLYQHEYWKRIEMKLDLGIFVQKIESISYQHNYLANANLKTSLYWVNVEARNVTLGWLREQGVQQPGTVSFDSEVDAVYIPYNQWSDFADMRTSRAHELELGDSGIRIGSIDHIAVPDQLFLENPESFLKLAGLALDYGRLRTVYVIIDTPKKINITNDDSKLQDRWEIEDTKVGAFELFVPDRRFVFTGDRISGADHLYDTIASACQRFALEVIEDFIKGPVLTGLQIMPVNAIRR
jgi:hypothetical protein